MAVSADRLFCPPEVEIDWLGLRGRAYDMQACGWKFEALEAHSSAFDPFGRRRQLIMRHQIGLTARAYCEERDLMNAINERIGHRRECPAIFRVEQVAANSSQMMFQGPVSPHPWGVKALDMKPELVDLRLAQMSRFSLASLYPERPAEEIIVEPATVMGLLEQIKQLQAPDLARIREENRKRDARDRVHEVRHATILSLAA